MSQYDSRAKRKRVAPPVRRSKAAKAAVSISDPAASLTPTGIPTGGRPDRHPASTRAEQPADDGMTKPCCRRFEFTDGFLLDTVTGQLWRFDNTAGVLLAVPRLDTVAAVQATGQAIMDKFQKAVDAYAQMLSITNIGD